MGVKTELEGLASLWAGPAQGGRKDGATPTGRGKPSEADFLFISRLGHGQGLLSEELFEILNKKRMPESRNPGQPCEVAAGGMELSFYF